MRCALAAVTTLTALLPAQNLVPNASLETYSTCPNTSGQIALAVGWDSPNGGTVEYLNACAAIPYSVPPNVWGNEPAHTGQAYAACIMWTPHSNSWREYIEAQLTSPLIAGNTYEVSFWLSLADMSGRAIADIGAHLNVGPHTGITNGDPLPVVPQVSNPAGNFITNTSGWVQVLGTFVASGGETHIAVGNFKDNASTPTVLNNGATGYATYYVDDVSVRNVTAGAGCASTLVGWSDLPLPATTGFIDIQQVDPCTPAYTHCTTTTPVRATTPWAGGTAYDPRYGTVWVSDGGTLAEYSIDAAGGCRPRCPPFRAVISEPTAVVSGLACSDLRPRLFQLATRPGLMELTIYDNSGRCPDRPVQCRRILPQGAVAAGLAFDEVNDLLLVTVSYPTSATTWGTWLWVSRAADPCSPLCENLPFGCSREIVTGLAYDSCEQRLFATDGRLTQIVEARDLVRCDIRLLGCCAKQLAPAWRGLDVLPCWKKTSVGRACLGRPCPSCTSMHFGTVGDPSLGTTFTLSLQAAPVASPAYLILAPGPCTPGVSLPPPFCGPIYPSLGGAIVVPVGTIGGIAPCGGQTSVGLSIPVNPGLCGQPLCAQWLVLCLATNQVGTGLSDALEFTIAGS